MKSNVASWGAQSTWFAQTPSKAPGPKISPDGLFWATPHIRKHLLLWNQNQPQLKLLRRPKEKSHKKRTQGIRINSAASFGMWYSKGSRGIIWEKCTEDILWIAFHYQISTFYIMFQSPLRLCLVIHVIRSELITAIMCQRVHFLVITFKQKWKRHFYNIFKDYFIKWREVYQRHKTPCSWKHNASAQFPGLCL